MNNEKSKGGVAMIKLGQIKAPPKTVKFKEWRQGKSPDELAGRYPVTLILLPTKYPSGAFIFETPDGERVKITVKGDTLKQILKEAGFKKENVEDVVLYFVITREGDYGVEPERDSSKIYLFKGNYWKLVDKSQVDEEDEIEL